MPPRCLWQYIDQGLSVRRAKSEGWVHTLLCEFGLQASGMSISPHTPVLGGGGGPKKDDL